MSNRLPWLKHDSQASMDGWLRKCIRNQGLEAGWIFWGLCEQLQTYGTKNTFTRDITDIANHSCTSPRVIMRVLVELALEVSLEPGVQVAPGVLVEQKVHWYRIKNELTIEIKNFRRKQDKLRLKTSAKPPQNTPQNGTEGEGDVEGEGDLDKRPKDATKTPKGNRAPASPRAPQHSTSLLCSYDDRGQGPCSNPRADRSKYCVGHKIKVAEKFHSKGQKRGGGLTSASVVLKAMEGGKGA